MSTVVRNHILQKHESDDMATDEMTSHARELLEQILGDGEWHSHRKILGDLIRTPLSEYAIRSVLKTIRSDPKVEAENRRASYRHSPSWWYRLSAQGAPDQPGKADTTRVR